MKKLIFVFFTVFLMTVSAFCRARQLEPIPTKHITIEEHNGKRIQSVTVNDLRITLIAREKDSKNIEVAVTITNLAERPFRFDEHSISVKRGNHYKNEWKTVYFDYPSDYYEAKKYSQTESDIETAIVATAATVITATTIAAIIDGFTHHASPPPQHHYEPSKPPKPSHHEPPRKNPKTPPRPPVQKAPPAPHRAPPPPRMYRPSAGHIAFGLLDTYLFLDAIDDYSNKYSNSIDDLEYLEDNLLFSQKIEPNATYYGVFFIPENRGPEYKITFKIPERNGEPAKKVNFYVEK